MNTTVTETVRLDLIDVGERLRQIDMDYAMLLAQSMSEVGQLQAIEIRPKNGGRYDLVSGGHRYTAAGINGLLEIRAEIVKSSDLEAELRQIDENLIRHDLNPLDRSTFLARRQELFIQLHPETAQGKAGAKARWDANDKLSFASDVAAKMGVSPRDIQRSIARFTKIAPDVRDKIAGTWVSRKGSELDALARLGPQEQRKVVKLLLQETAPTKSVAAARRELTGNVEASVDVDAEKLSRLQEAWRKSGAKVHVQFLDWLDESGALAAWKKRTEA